MRPKIYSSSSYYTMGGISREKNLWIAWQKKGTMYEKCEVQVGMEIRKRIYKNSKK